MVVGTLARWKRRCARALLETVWLGQGWFLVRRRKREFDEPLFFTLLHGRNRLEHLQARIQTRWLHAWLNRPRRHLALGDGMLAAIEDYLETCDQEWVDDYLALLTGHREVRKEPWRFRCLVEFHGWRIAAATGWSEVEEPVRVDPVGWISLRDMARLWHAFASDDEAWRSLDLSSFRSKCWSRNPLVRAAWRISTRSREGRLSPRHERALREVMEHPLGWLSLAVEEAHEQAESLGDLYGLAAIEEWSRDPVLRRRCSLDATRARILLDLARAHLRVGAFGRAYEHFAQWERLCDGRAPSAEVERVVSEFQAFSRLPRRDEGGAADEMVQKGLEMLASVVEVAERADVLSPDLAADVYRASGEHVLGQRDPERASVLLGQALQLVSKLPNRSALWPELLLSSIEARWRLVVDDLFEAGFYQGDASRAREILERHRPTFESIAEDLQAAAHDVLLDLSGSSPTLRYRWNIARSVVLEDPSHALALMASVLEQSAGSDEHEGHVERASDVLVPLLLLGASTEEILDSPPVRRAVRSRGDVRQHLRSILDGTRHPLYGPIDPEAAPPTYAALREQSGTVH